MKKLVGFIFLSSLLIISCNKNKEKKICIEGGEWTETAEYYNMNDGVETPYCRGIYGAMRVTDTNTQNYNDASKYQMAFSFFTFADFVVFGGEEQFKNGDIIYGDANNYGNSIELHNNNILGDFNISSYNQSVSYNSGIAYKFEIYSIDFSTNRMDASFIIEYNLSDPETGTSEYKIDELRLTNYLFCSEPWPYSCPSE